MNTGEIYSSHTSNNPLLGSFGQYSSPLSKEFTGPRESVPRPLVQYDLGSQDPRFSAQRFTPKVFTSSLGIPRVGYTTVGYTFRSTG